MGLVAALYFVVDSGLPSYKTDLSEADARTTRILQLYRTGEENLETICSDPETADLTPDLCSLAQVMKWGIKNCLDMKDFLRARIDLPEWVAGLASDPALTSQIRTLNDWACKKISAEKRAR